MFPIILLSAKSRTITLLGWPLLQLVTVRAGLVRQDETKHPSPSNHPASNRATPTTSVTRSEGFGLLMMIVAALIWSGISPHDRLTWFIEVIWVIAAIALLLAARPHFRITLLR